MFRYLRNLRRDVSQPSGPTHQSSAPLGSSVDSLNQSRRKNGFFRGSRVETTSPTSGRRATGRLWRQRSTQRLGPSGATTIRSGSKSQSQAASARVDRESATAASDASSPRANSS